MLYPDKVPLRRTAQLFVFRGLLLVAVLTVLSALQLSYATAQRPPTKVVVDVARETEVSQTFPVIGRFVARQFGVVAALTNGPMKEVLVEVGDRVEQGDVMARLVLARIRANRDLLAAEVREKEAGVRTAEAQLKLTMDEMARLDGLRKSAAFSQARYNDKRNEITKVRSEATEAEAALSRARANLKLASIDLHNAEIRAPFDAVVVRKHAVAGAYLSVGDPVVTLVNDREMEIEADVPSERLAGVLPGRDVGVLMDDGKSIDAVIRAIVPSENAKTRTRPVRFSLNAKDGVNAPVAANQSVTVLLPVAGAQKVLTVHKDAVTARGKDRVVITIVDNAATPRNIRIGESVGDRFVVLSGLQAGDIVVIRGNEGLRPGQKVTFDAPAG